MIWVMEDPGTAAETPRTIVVTGVTRGLGRALVQRFDERGHQVAGCGRSTGPLEELARGVADRHHFARVDVAVAESVDAWSERVLARFGPPDLLINNAARMNDPARLWEVSALEFDALLAVNVSGVANVVRAFVPAMVERGSGVIVNLSSGWGRSTSPEVGPYCTTKWAVEGFTGSLAQELPAGLAAVALNPGVIDTDMLRQCWDDAASAYEDADSWSRRAADFLLGLGAEHNGQALTAP